MPIADFNRWVRYYHQEPFGFQREEIRHANIVSAVLRSGYRTPKDSQQIQPRYWIYKVHKKPKASEVLANMKALSGAAKTYKRRRSAH